MYLQDLMHILKRELFFQALTDVKLDVKSVFQWHMFQYFGYRWYILILNVKCQFPLQFQEIIQSKIDVQFMSLYFILFGKRSY